MYPIPDNAPKSFTPDQLAKLLDVKTATIYAWISRGELQSNKAGYSRSISQDQLYRFIVSRASGKYMFALEHIR